MHTCLYRPQKLRTGSGERGLHSFPTSARWGLSDRPLKLIVVIHSEMARGDRAMGGSPGEGTGAFTGRDGEVAGTPPTTQAHSRKVDVCTEGALA